ncbi:MAG TPA: CDP-glucose 4,6-dehydratase [Acidimicrobiales bacterium]|nr:CDP-glucose 4,6-dehydratase [Acidimicrobiales bacterium]
MSGGPGDHPGDVSLREVLARSYAGRRVLVTGHTGFVGAWLALALARAGAEVTGFSLSPESGALGETARVGDVVSSVTGDVRDLDALCAVVARCEPEIVLHLAAQALVLPSVTDPVGTFTTNVIGTANLLEALRVAGRRAACVVVTSDKCYATADAAHLESDPLGGDDPYSASKAGAELVVHAYRSTVADVGRPFIASARAGNIIGGGDVAASRVVPDCIRAIAAGAPVRLRRPQAVRPWQHVLDALAGYVRLGDALSRGEPGAATAWNFGPPPAASATVLDVSRAVVEAWRRCGGRALDPVGAEQDSPERSSLRLESTKAVTALGWSTLLALPDALEWTVAWYHAATVRGAPAATLCTEQIDRYLELEEAGRDRGAARPPTLGSGASVVALGTR